MNGQKSIDNGESGRLDVFALGAQAGVAGDAYFDDFTALGACYVNGDGLSHYPFNEGCHHRVKVIQSLVE